MTVRRRLSLTVIAVAVVCTFCGVPVAGWCSQPSTTPDQPPSRRQLAVAQLLSRLDRNRDGVLQMGEIPRRSRLQVALAARRRGLDPSKPLPLAQLTRPINSSRPTPGATAKSTAPEVTAVASKKKPDSANESDNAASIAVPGFGLPASQPPVPGFGVPPPAANVVEVDASAESRKGKKSVASVPSADARVRRYATTMLAQYDKNKNGQLEKEEWRRMRGKLKQADRNGDDVLSLDELTDHLAGFGSRRDTRTNPASVVGHGASRRSKQREGTRRSYRFRSPHERLPKGLPDWFTRKDADLDGQVSMAEFSSVWTRSQLEDFARLDLNGDGFIVSKECLRATTGKK
jgi:hypothetical protein